eukprot:2504813-Rhodomonas_salina.2
MFALLDQCPDEWSLFESFEEFDLDKGKTLSLREFFAWIQTLDLHANHYSVESVQQLAAALDEDGCGFISFDEVLPVYQSDSELLMDGQSQVVRGSGQVNLTLCRSAGLSEKDRKRRRGERKKPEMTS